MTFCRNTASFCETFEHFALYKIGDRVRKKSGSSWHGFVCGYYSTGKTRVGYAVESEREVGSVQIYPQEALELVESK